MMRGRILRSGPQNYENRKKELSWWHLGKGTILQVNGHKYYDSEGFWTVPARPYGKDMLDIG
jgi:hypothetical protein